MRLEECLPKVRDGAKLLWGKYSFDRSMRFGLGCLLDTNWSIELEEPEQPKKIEELSFVGCENDMITCLQLVRISINEIVRELKRRDRAT